MEKCIWYVENNLFQKLKQTRCLSGKRTCPSSKDSLMRGETLQYFFVLEKEKEKKTGKLYDKCLFLIGHWVLNQSLTVTADVQIESAFIRINCSACNIPFHWKGCSEYLVCILPTHEMSTRAEYDAQITTVNKLFVTDGILRKILFHIMILLHGQCILWI